MPDPKMPTKLGARGRTFWRAIVGEYELSRAELELLAEACRAMDQIDGLRKAVADDGYTILGSTGQRRVHPAVSQLNATRALLARLLAQLDLPDDAGQAMASQQTLRARAAAQARWADHNAAKAKVTELHRRGPA